MANQITVTACDNDSSSSLTNGVQASSFAES